MDNVSWQYERLWPLAVLVLLPLVLYYSRRTLVHFGLWQRALSMILRIVLVGVLAVALCGITIHSRLDKQCVVLLDDISSSIPGESAGAIDPFVAEAENHTEQIRTEVVEFASKPKEFRFDLPEGETIEAATPDRKGSDLAAAVTEAAAFVPDWKSRLGFGAPRVAKMVLFSDGNQITGDVLAAAKAAGVPISVVPLPGQAKDEVYVMSVATKGQVRLGEPFHIDVTVYSTGENEGTLRLLDGTQLVVDEQVQLVPGVNRFRYRRSVVGRPVATLTAKLEGFKDTLPENNEAGGVVFTTAKPRVLLIESQPVLAKHLQSALIGENIEVEVRPPEKLSERLDDLQQYELLILSNVPATSLPDERVEVIHKYVGELGGGLIVVGGDRAFTPGGYRNTMIEQILPVICEPKKDKPKPRLAMMLVMDKSGSMKGKAIELTRQAARKAVERLGPRDKIGIIAFEDKSAWVSEISPVADKQAILARIDTIVAAGGTNTFPAVERAYLALNEAHADLKHMIVLTDGLCHPGDFQQLARDIAAAGITISTVAVGDEAAKDVLRDMAEGGGGNFYYCDDPAMIPKIFELETISKGKVGITDEPFIAQVVSSHEVLRGLDFTEVPTLMGYVETQAKPTGRVILSSQDKPPLPLLVSWRYGRGVSVAFTSDIQSRWAAAWLRWPGFGPFWAQLVRNAMRKDETRDFTLSVENDKGRGRVMLEAVGARGEFLDGEDAGSTLKHIDPDGKVHSQPLRHVAPGRHAAEFDATTPGTYYLEATFKHSGRVVYFQRRGLVVGYPEELAVGPANVELLKSIAEATGGRYDPKPADVYAPTTRTAPITIRLWSYLLILGALLFVLDLYLKRHELGAKR